MDAAFPPLRSWKGHCLHNGAGYVLIQAWPTGDLDESFSELQLRVPGGALASPESSTPPRTLPGEALSLEETPRTSGLISFAPSPQLDPRFGVDLALAVSECPALWPSPRVEMSGLEALQEQEVGPSCKCKSGHVVPMHTKFVDSGHFEGEELESLLLTETGTGPDGEVEQCSQDCELTFEGETIADAGEKSVPCELRNLVETFLDVPALVVAFLAAFLASVQLRSMRSEDKAPTSVPEAASASDLIVDEFGCTALHRAADEGSVTEVERLLKGGLDVEAKEAWEETPLHIAARKGHADCVARFLAAGANSE
ncbi:psmD10, partial [Symbiodinium necroappetens]